MHRIVCPNCDYEHVASFDSEGYSECPNCGVTLALGGVNHDHVMEFEDCVAETAKIIEEVKNLDDDALEEEIAEYVNQYDFMKNVFNIFVEMETLGYMAYDTRKRAEGVYILMHSNMNFGYEQ